MPINGRALKRLLSLSNIKSYYYLFEISQGIFEHIRKSESIKIDAYAGKNKKITKATMNKKFKNQKN